jgi:hypothetical protein
MTAPRVGATGIPYDSIGTLAGNRPTAAGSRNRRRRADGDQDKYRDAEPGQKRKPADLLLGEIERGSALRLPLKGQRTVGRGQLLS